MEKCQDGFVSQDANLDRSIQDAVEINPSRLVEAAYNHAMLSRRCCWILRLCLGLAVLHASFATAEIASPEQLALDQAAADLSSSDFKAREAATRFLWKHADDAGKQLKDAQESDDAEVRVRAERIQEAHQLGILPDTPIDVARRIYEFHDGDLRKKQQILSELISSEDLTTVQRLLRSVENDALRDQLAQGLASAFRVKLLDQLTSEDWESAVALLERAALTQIGMRDYAVFAHLTGRTDDALANARDTPHGRQVKFWLLRAADRLEEALEMAKDDVELTNILKSANGDPVAFCDLALKDQTASPPQRARFRAFKARFTNDQEGYDQAIADLINIAKVTDDFHQREAIDALFLNGVVDPVLSHLPKIPSKGPYDIQAFRADYGGALKAVGINVDKPPFTEWVEERCARLRKDANDSCFDDLLELAGNIYEMGSTEEALRITQATYEATEGSLERQEAVLRREIKIGMRDRAETRLRKIAETASIDELRDRFIIGSSIVEQWYDHFVEQEEGQEAKPRLDTLFRAWRLIQVTEDDEPMPEAEIDALLDAGFAKVATMPARERTNYLRNLWVTADEHGRRDKALVYLEELDKLSPEGYWTGNLAEAQEERKQWLAAAKTFERMWQTNLSEAKTSLRANNAQNANAQALRPVLLYRAGKAYEKAGETNKGTQMTRQARLLCLGDLEARFSLARAMSVMEEEELALEEWELVARLSQPNDSLGMQTFNILANEHKKTDLRRAIRYLERAMVSRHVLGELRSMFIYTYDLSLQSRWCQWTALLHMEEGNADAAVAAIQQFWELTPGNASIGEELLPKLEAAGKTKEALEFYEKTRALTVEACEIFPKSAMALNNLAWLDARSRRNLDTALEKATLACKLRPRTAAYMDTLAEVHFAMGDRAKALELSDEAIKYLPDDEELQGQRERFENAPLPEKR